MRTIRIVTVKVTGSRYILQQRDFRTDKAHVWGEVLVADTRKGTKHEGSKSFDLVEVEVSDEQPMTQALMDELFEQSRRAHKDQIESGKMTVHVSRHRK